MKIKRYCKAQLSKVKFELGMSPIIKGKAEKSGTYIPTPFKSVCLISADFELAWASRYSKGALDPLTKAINDGHKTRENIPPILDLCDKYEIPITWATVGHLFLEKCSPVNGAKHPEIPRLPYFENRYWEYAQGDWFDHDPCSDYSTDPAWFAPDLIKEILSREAKHEIGCHTFSHIDCSDNINNGAAFAAEINKCIELAGEWGLQLRSFVHPGHTIGNLEKLHELGFTSFRTDYGDTLGYPVRHFENLWELRNTAGLDWREGWCVAYHVYRYKTIIERAIKYNRLCVLWFHPSLPTRFVEQVLPEIFAHLAQRAPEIKCLTHGSYTNWLNGGSL